MSIATAAKRGLLAKTGQSGAPVKPSFAYQLPTANPVFANDWPYIELSDLHGTVSCTYVSHDGKYLYLFDTTSASGQETIRQYEFTYPFSFGSIKNPNLSSNVHNISTFELAPNKNPDINRMLFSTDGSNIYLLNEATGDHAVRLPLSMPWHANTIDSTSPYLASKYESFSKSNSFLGSVDAWTAHDLFWKYDGTKMYFYQRDLDDRLDFTGFYSFTATTPWSFANIKFDGRFDYGTYIISQFAMVPGALTQSALQFWDNDRRISMMGTSIVDVLTSHYIGHEDEPNLFSFTTAHQSPSLGENDPSKISAYDNAPRAFFIQGGTDGGPGNIYIIGGTSLSTILPATTNAAVAAYSFNNGNIAAATFQYLHRGWGANSGLVRSVQAGTAGNYWNRLWMNDHGNVCVSLDVATGADTRYYYRVWDLATRYDLRTADWRGGNNYPRCWIGAYDGTNTGATTPTGMKFGNSGYNLYIGCSGTDYIYQFKCKYPYSFANVIFEKRFSVAAQATAHMGFYIDQTNGEHMYIMNSALDTVIEYELGVGWDIGTAAFIRSLSVTANDATPSGIFFKPDGTVMYYTGATADRVWQRTLSAPWNISTTGAATSLLVSGQETAPRSIVLSSDGTRLYVMGTTGNDINYYSLGTAWNVTTGTYNSVFGNSATLGTAADMHIGPDGKNIWTSPTDLLHVTRRTMDTAYSITTAKLGNIQANTWGISYTTSGISATPKSFWVNQEMNRFWTMSGLAGSTSTTSGGIQELSFPGNALDFSNYTISGTKAPNDLGTDGLLAYNFRSTLATPKTIQWNRTGNIMLFVFNNGDNADYLNVQKFKFATPYSLSSMIGNSKVVSGTTGASPNFTVFGTASAGGTVAQGRLNPEGNIYVQYNINVNNSSQWWRFDFSNDDVSTMTYVGNVNMSNKVQQAVTGYQGTHFNTVILNNQNEGATVSDDGKTWYVQGSAGHGYKWTSTTAWDFNTANVTNTSVNVGVFNIPLTLDTGPNSIRVQDNGTNVYITCTTNNIVAHYLMTTPYDINTCVFIQTVSNLPQTGVRDIDWHPDGTSYFLVSLNQDNVMARTGLTVPWDPSTYTAFANVRVILQDTSPESIDFRPDGTQFIMLGDTNDRIYRYDLGTAWDITTATLVQTSDSLGGAGAIGGTSPTSVRRNNTGTVIYVCHGASDRIDQSVEMSAWTVNSVAAQYSRMIQPASFSTDGTAGFGATEAFAINSLLIRGISFAQQGRRMYMMCNNSDFGIAETKIFQYDL